MKIYCYDDRKQKIVSFFLLDENVKKHVQTSLREGECIREEVSELLFNEGLRKESARVSMVFVSIPSGKEKAPTS